MDPRRTVIAHSDAKFASCNLDQLVIDPAARGIDTNIAERLLDKGFNLSVEVVSGLWWKSEGVIIRGS
jgi:hypothetical protein